MRSMMQRWLALLAFVLAIPATGPGHATSVNSRSLGCDQQAVLRVSDRAVRSPLDAVRRDCPLLGLIIEKFAMQDLGEAFPVEVPAPHPREIAIVAAAAVSGNVDEVRRFTRVALANGATPAEFEEMLYLTAVNAGIPKAINATRAIADLIGSSPARGCVEASSQF